MLASAWPELTSDVGAPPVKFDPQFLASLKPTDFALYGRNMRGVRRNQLEDTRSVHKSANSGLKAPKFLSEKARDLAKSESSSAGDKTDELSNPLAGMEIGSRKSDLPIMYRNVEIKYSKFGVDDFDFGYVIQVLLPLNSLLTGQLLQPNTTLWSRDSHIELIRKLASSNYALYALNSKPGFTTCSHRLRERRLSPVRTGVSL